MDRLNLSQLGGMGHTADDLEYMCNALRASFSHFSTGPAGVDNANYIISGSMHAVNGADYECEVGYICIEGESFKIPSQLVLSAFDVNEHVILEVVENTSHTETTESGVPFDQYVSRDIQIINQSADPTASQLLLRPKDGSMLLADQSFRVILGQGYLNADKAEMRAISKRVHPAMLNGWALELDKDAALGTHDQLAFHMDFTGEIHVSGYVDGSAATSFQICSLPVSEGYDLDQGLTIPGRTYHFKKGILVVENTGPADVYTVTLDNNGLFCQNITGVPPAAYPKGEVMLGGIFNENPPAV